VTGGRRPEPSRITVALDMAGLFGDDADRTLGVIPPVVDLWETGALVPTDEQLADLAERAGVLVAWFYDGPIEPLTFNVCYATKKAAGGGDRCQRVTYPELPERPEGVLF
jgi:hypothetical protein